MSVATGVRGAGLDSVQSVFSLRKSQNLLYSNFSCHLSKVHDDINKPLTILGLLLHIGVLVGLILLQPDMGSVLVFCLCLYVLCLLQNFHINIYCRLVWQVSRHCLLYISMYFRNISRNVFRCFKSNLDPRGRGYNVIQSKIAVGSGQLWGKGYLQERKTKWVICLLNIPTLYSV